jgi:hypothetical protein
MKTRSYLVLCGCVAAVWVLGLLAVPAFSQAVEQLLLLFLSTNAR